MGQVNDYWGFKQELKIGKQSFREHVFKTYPSNSPRVDSMFPRLWEYLQIYEKEFRNREAGRYKRGKQEEWRWYELARPQNLERNFVDKVLIQELAKTSTVVTDSEGFVIARARAYGIIPQSVSTLFLSGILSSSVSNFFIKHISAPYSGGYYSYGDQSIKDLPIPPASEDQQAAIAEFARTLTETTATLRSLAAAVRAFPDSVTAARRETGDVPDLEALERLGLLEGLPRVVQAAQVSSTHDLMGQVVLKVGKGRMTLKPALAELVLAALKVRRSLSYEALASLNVPEREGEQRAYVEALRGWQEQIVRLRAEIVGLEAELNSKVYEVYGLREERGVIEAFLERF